MELLIEFFSSYGYWAVFLVLLACGFGLPIPEDVTLVSGGVISGLGYTNVHWMLFVSMLGVLVGDSTMYWLGRIYGEKILQFPLIRRIATPERFAKVQERFEKQGWKLLFVARFLPGLRAVVYLVSGITRRVTFTRFVLVDFFAGESTPLVYKYHIVTKAELADPANIESSREVNAKYEDYIGADVFHSQFISDFRAAYAEIGKYINVNFVEVDTVAEADTNVYIAAAEKLRGYAAWAWSGYNIIWNGGISYEKPTINYSFYTALHEIGHTLDMADSSNGFKNTFRAKEDTLE